MRVLAVSMCALLTACVTPMAVSVTKYEEADLKTAGLADAEFLAEYGLAESSIRVTLSAAKGKTDAAADAEDKAGTIYSNTVNVGATADVTTKKSKAADEPTKSSSKAPTSLAAACVDLRSAYNGARGLALQEYANHNAMIEFVGTLPDDRASIPASDRKATIKKLKAFAATVQSSAVLVNAARSNLAKINDSCPTSLVVKLEEVVSMSQSQTFRLYAHRPLLADNNITLEMENGYIKSIIASSEGRLGDIAAAAGKLIGTIKGGGMSPAIDATPSGESGLKKAIDDFSKSWNEQSRQQLTAALEQSRLEFDDRLPAIDPELPWQQTYALSEIERGIVLPSEANVMLTLKCTGGIPNSSSPTNTEKTIQGSNNAESKEPESKKPKSKKPEPPPEGVLVSGVRPCRIVATRSNDSHPLGQFDFIAADPTRPVQLPLPSQPFVKDTSNYTLAGGRQTKTEWVRPSPVASGLSIPGRALGGFFEGVVAGIAGPKGVADAETARTEADIKKLEAADKLRKLKTDEDDDTEVEE